MKLLYEWLAKVLVEPTIKVKLKVQFSLLIEVQRSFTNLDSIEAEARKVGT